MQNQETLSFVLPMALQHANKNYPFMSCIVKVHVGSSWQNTVRKVLNKCHGVYSFRMNDNGLVEISGTVDPELLLKSLGKAGRKAELRWFQFGECSSNLFVPFSNDGRFLHVDSFPRPTAPSYEQIMLTSNAAKHDRRISYYDDRREDDYSRPSTPDGDNIVCCRVM